MSYGIWLYKEIINDSGRKTRLEIEKRDYSGASIEIGALSGDIVLSIDTDLPTAPIVKSNLSFAIIDTEQVTYSDFFTPDATLYRVKVYDVAGQTQTIRWTGFITPDSFAEPLEYRSAINLTARDNLGYLNDLEFDYNGLTSETYASIKNIINAALPKIGHGSAAGGMSVEWNVAKKAATESGGTFDNIEDAIVSTYTMLGDTWGNAVEALLKGIGCQLRYIDGNSFAVYDIEALSDSATFAAQAVQFLNKSGYREIQPAWKRGVFSQDYLLVTDVIFPPPTGFDGRIQIAQSEQRRVGQGITMMRTSLSGWSVSRGPLGSPVVDWGVIDPSDVNTGTVDADAIYIPLSNEADNSIRKQMYIQKNIGLAMIGAPIEVKITIMQEMFTTPYHPEGWQNQSVMGLTPIPVVSAQRHHIKQTFLYDIVLVGENGNTYHCRDTWELSGSLSSPWLSVTTYGTDGIGTPIAEFTITNTINSMPCNGALFVRIIAPMGEYRLIDSYPIFASNSETCVKVRSVSISPASEPSGGRSRLAVINRAHNVSGEDSYTFGQTPAIFDINFFKGGIYKNDTQHTPYAYFKRTATATETNNLLDLIGRETIQYHKKSFNLLSGTVQALLRTSLMTFGTLSYGGKRYLPLSAALNMLENTISITSMLEIENYTEEAGIVFSDYAGKNSYSGRSGYSGGGSSSGGSSISQHGQLAGRDAEDSHPMSAITGLSDLFEYDSVNDVLIIKKAIVSAYDAQFLHSNS